MLSIVNISRTIAFDIRIGENVDREEIIDFAIGKLAELKIKADFEDRDRKKIRYVKKSQAYQDLINLLKGMKYYE